MKQCHVTPLRPYYIHPCTQGKQKQGWKLVFGSSFCWAEKWKHIHLKMLTMIVPN